MSLWQVRFQGAQTDLQRRRNIRYPRLGTCNVQYFTRWANKLPYYNANLRLVHYIQCTVHVLSPVYNFDTGAVFITQSGKTLESLLYNIVRCRSVITYKTRNLRMNIMHIMQWKNNISFTYFYLLIHLT